MEYNFILQWRPGVLKSAPDAFSMLPPGDGTPSPDIDAFLPGDQPGDQSAYVGPRGPFLNDEVLDERYPAGGGDDGKNGTFSISALFMDRGDETASSLSSEPLEPVGVTHTALTVPPFANCAVIDPSGPRRSSRQRSPSVRLRPIGDVPA